jgi:hypothetical protein
MRNPNKILVENLKPRQHMGGLAIYIWKQTIKISLNEIMWEHADWIHLINVMTYNEKLF